MPIHLPTVASSEVESRILTVLQRHPRMMFLDLADVLYGYSWQRLLSALSRLHHQQKVDLYPHPFDQEVVLRNGRDNVV